jgi:molybdopterin-guanine dinucleotide biosynthesis protein A
MAPQVGRLALNANGDPERFAGFGLPVVADAGTAGEGPLAGLLAGLHWAREHAPEASHVLTAPADTPFLPEDLLARLAAVLSADGGKGVIAGSVGRAHPTIGLWPVGLAEVLDAAFAGGLRKAQVWAERHAAATVEFAALRIGAARVDPFFNVNTPDDLAFVRALVEAEGS